MNDPLEQQTIIDFLLESEKHLDSAARMARVFPVVQRKLVVAVLDGLEQRLAPLAGSGWQVYNPRNEVLLANYPRLTLWREGWSDHCLSLENQTQEGSSVVGIWREKRPPTNALDDALAAAFAAKGFSGNRNRWWAWYKILPPEIGDWSSAPALSAMHFKCKEIIDRLADELAQVREIASPIIEAHFRKT